MLSLATRGRFSLRIFLAFDFQSASAETQTKTTKRVSFLAFFQYLFGNMNFKKFRYKMAFVWIVCAVSVLGDSIRADWPQFRGPTGQGISDADALPLSWSEDSNVVWKTAIHGKGWSSPVVAGDKIWLTTATEDGRRLSGICVNAESGSVLSDRILFRVDQPQFAHKFNSYASPTPTTDGARVYLSFGAEGTVCLDAETGELLWQRRDIYCNHFRGAGSSLLWIGQPFYSSQKYWHFFSSIAQ